MSPVSTKDSHYNFAAAGGSNGPFSLSMKREVTRQGETSPTDGGRLALREIWDVNRLNILAVCLALVSAGISVGIIMALQTYNIKLPWS